MKVLILCLLFYCALLPAQSILSLNPMLSHLLLDLGLPKSQVESLSLNNNDPHHHEWSTAQVKKILSAELLIAPPFELNPGLRSLLNKRQKSSLVLKVKADDKRFSHAHFWFYPEVSCQLREQIAQYLKLKSTDCPYRGVPLPPLDYALIVVSHEALAPLFSEAKIPLLILQSTRDGEQNAAKLKALSAAINEHAARPILWIKEIPYHGKMNLERYARKQDKLIEVSLLSEKELFSSLQSLVSQLKKAP